MKILFITHSFNSLSQRLYCELTGRGHQVSIEFDISEPGCTPRLTATTDNGKITLVETTTFRVAFSRSEMSCLCAGQYDVGSTVENGGTTRSFIIGTLPVLDGRVSR